jgi:hypothetical protein
MGFTHIRLSENVGLTLRLTQDGCQNKIKRSTPDTTGIQTSTFSKLAQALFPTGTCDKSRKAPVV